jgi:hypothetical protein
VTENFLYVQNLEERVTYTFSVRAQTLDYGPPALANVTTGPQPGSPNRPLDLQLTKTWSAVRLSWSNGISGKGPIQGYYIESRQKGETFFLISVLLNRCLEIFSLQFPYSILKNPNKSTYIRFSNVIQNKSGRVFFVSVLGRKYLI